MSLRTVFGRRKVEFEGRQFTIELRNDGIYIRQKRSRSEWRLPFEKLLNHAKRQPEFFVGQGDQIQPVPDLSKDPLVPSEFIGPPLPVYAPGEQPPQTTEDGGTGVVTSAEWGEEYKLEPFKKLYPTNDSERILGLPTFIGPLENPDPEPPAAAASEEPRCDAPGPDDSGSGMGDGASSVGVPDA